ncbi:MAG: DUF86 domain-containing protein [Armatimonadetes bacterium]|nr:DUF86 domain-containing protein [Armatimonadota bacterium]
MMDRELVTRKARMILQDLDHLNRLTDKGEEGFLADPVHSVLAERYLERIIGRMIDINYHLLTTAGDGPPSDYFQSFTALAGLGVLPPGFARQLAPGAGLRNRLVHEYDELDPTRIYGAMARARTEVSEYLRHIQAFLDRQFQDAE